MEERLPGEIITFTTRSISHDSVDKKIRYAQIIEILKDREMTAKEIAVEMYNKGYSYSAERNISAPRLTELSQKGIVEPIGKKKCEYSGKSVAVYKLREEQTNIYDFLKEE